MTVKNPSTYSAKQLREKAAALQELADGLPNGPEAWIKGVRMTIWALEVSAALVEHLDVNIEAAARTNGLALLPVVMDELRAQAVDAFMKGSPFP